MATWQFDCHLLPLRAVQEQFVTIPLTITREQFDAIAWWDGAGDTQGVVSDLSKLLPSIPSWSPSIASWGESDGDRIDISCFDGSLDGILVRFDARVMTAGFISPVTQIARARSLLFLTEDQHVLRPSYPELVAALRRSTSFEYVTDPVGFLTRLREQLHDE